MYDVKFANNILAVQVAALVPQSCTAELHELLQHRSPCAATSQSVCRRAACLATAAATAYSIFCCGNFLIKRGRSGKKGGPTWFAKLLGTFSAALAMTEEARHIRLQQTQAAYELGSVV